MSQAKKNVTLNGRSFECYIPEAAIHEAIAQVADQINDDYRHGAFAPRPLLLITLNGAVVFGGELFRQLEGDFEVGFVRPSSYGSGLESSGQVEVQVPLTESVAGRDVVIAEDIVDTGGTIERLHALLTVAGARSIRVATLLLKPEVYSNAIELDYVALECENRFVVGYGLDYNEQGRNLSDIYVLKEE